MATLKQLYGRPHQLALQQIANSGDVKAFRNFTLKVSSQVSLWEQLGTKGEVELECGWQSSPMTYEPTSADIFTSRRCFTSPTG